MEHVEFIRFDPENKERRLVPLPVTYWNHVKSPGLKFNGWLNDRAVSVPIWVHDLDFPTSVNINLAGMDHGEKVWVKSMIPHPKFSIYRKHYKDLLCSIKKVPRGADD